MQHNIIKKIIVIFLTISTLLAILPTATSNHRILNIKISENDYDPLNEKIDASYKVESDEIVSNEIIVKFKEKIEIKQQFIVDPLNIGIYSFDKINTKYNILSAEKIINRKNSPLSNVLKITTPKNIDIYSVIEEYNNDPNVEFAEPNYKYFLCNIPNDPLFSKQWRLHNTGQLNGTSGIDIKAIEAWNITTGNSDVVVAVIDSGIDYNHPDLKDNIWINKNEIPGNGVDDDGNGYIDDIRGWNFVDNNNDPIDTIGHGTHCAGIIGAIGNNNLGISGVCWNISIMPVKAINVFGHSDNIANAIVYAADNGADVISMSLGCYHESKLMKDAIDYAYSKDIVLVAAAGNDNIKTKSYPAAFEKVISVAAIDKNNNKADFSNYGNWVDLAAPGVDIYSTMPTYRSKSLKGIPKNYAYASGTSMATPFVAGAVALMLSINPDMNQEEIKTLIKSTASKVDSCRYIGTGNINLFHFLQNDTAPIVNIKSRLNDIEVEGVINITGSAYGKTFKEYTISIGSDIYPDSWDILYSSVCPVENDILFVLNTKLFEEGLYSLKLQVEDINGNYFQDRKVILINNYQNTFYVGHNQNANYSTIQEAVKNSGNGDTIYVYNGSYKENVLIERNIIFIGEDKNSTFLLGTISFCKVSDIEISGFTFSKSNAIIQTIDRSIDKLKTSGNYLKSRSPTPANLNVGLDVQNSKNVTIEDNIFINFSASTLSQNPNIQYFEEFSECIVGIHISVSNYINVKNNTIKLGGNKKENFPLIGIAIYGSKNICVNNNLIVNNTHGIYCLNKGMFHINNSFNIYNNIIKGNINGINLGPKADRLNIFNNTIEYNYIGIQGFKAPLSIALPLKDSLTLFDFGILMYLIWNFMFNFYNIRSRNRLNNIHHNSIKNNHKGIYLEKWCDNTISNNDFENNTIFALRLSKSKNNQIINNNFINNGRLSWKIGNAMSIRRNIWDGNYWDTYKGLLFSNIIDPDGDGFGNVPYIIPFLQFDRNPKMEPYVFSI